MEMFGMHSFTYGYSSRTNAATRKKRRKTKRKSIARAGRRLYVPRRWGCLILRGNQKKSREKLTNRSKEEKKEERDFLAWAINYALIPALSMMHRRYWHLPCLPFTLSVRLSPLSSVMRRKHSVRVMGRGSREENGYVYIDPLRSGGGGKSRGSLYPRARPLPLERVLIECTSAASSHFSSLPHEEAGRLVGKAVRLLGMRVQGN